MIKFGNLLGNDENVQLRPHVRFKNSCKKDKCKNGRKCMFNFKVHAKKDNKAKQNFQNRKNRYAKIDMQKNRYAKIDMQKWVDNII